MTFRQTLNYNNIPIGQKFGVDQGSTRRLVVNQGSRKALSFGLALVKKMSCDIFPLMHEQLCYIVRFRVDHGRARGLCRQSGFRKGSLSLYSYCIVLSNLFCIKLWLLALRQTFTCQVTTIIYYCGFSVCDLIKW